MLYRLINKSLGCELGASLCFSVRSTPNWSDANVMTVKTLTLQRHYPSFIHSKCNLPLALNIDCCTEGIQSLNMIGQRAFSAQISSTLFIDSPNSYVDVCLYSLHSIGSRRVL